MHALAHPRWSHEQRGVLDRAPQVAAADPAEPVTDLLGFGPPAGGGADDGASPHQGTSTCRGSRLGGGGEPRQGAHPARVGSAPQRAAQDPPCQDPNRDAGGEDGASGEPVGDRAGQLAWVLPRRPGVADPAEGTQGGQRTAGRRRPAGEEAGQCCAAPQHPAEPDDDGPGAEGPAGQVEPRPACDGGAARSGVHPATGPCHLWSTARSTAFRRA